MDFCWCCKKEWTNIEPWWKLHYVCVSIELASHLFFHSWCSCLSLVSSPNCFAACKSWFISNHVMFDLGVEMFKSGLTGHSVIGKLRWPICRLASSELRTTAGKTQNLPPAVWLTAYLQRQRFHPKSHQVLFRIYLPLRFGPQKHHHGHLFRVPASWKCLATWGPRATAGTLQ